jgi:uncharacterized protein
MRQRLVIDTNVLISAAISEAGLAARLLDHALLSEQVVLCEASYTEFASRLAKPKFERYIDHAQRNRILLNLHALAVWQNDPPPFVNAVRCRDPKDNLFIDLALHSKASMLITGDQDLLVLASELATHGLQVLPPAQALALLQAD